MTNTTTDWEAKMKEVISLARKQNWKNGGVHEYDTDEIEELLSEVFRTEKEKSYQEGVAAENNKLAALVGTALHGIELDAMTLHKLNMLFTPTNTV